MATVRQTNAIYLNMLIDAECSKLETLIGEYSRVFFDQNKFSGYQANEILDVLMSEIKSCAETIDRLAGGGG